MTKWRSVASDLPGWKESGPGELRREDGIVETGEFDIVSEFFTGEDEIPIFEFVTDDGRKLDIHSFHEWRLVKRC